MGRERTCKTCRWWYAMANKGECRRFPPRPTLTQMPNQHDEFVVMPEWPRTTSHDWCGEWAPKSER